MRSTDGGGRARVLPRLLLAALTALAAPACHGGAPAADDADADRVARDRPTAPHPPPDGTGMPSAPSDSLRLRVDVPDRVAPGDPVPITFRVHNVTDRTLTLYLMGRDIAFDVVVERTDGATVWRRLEGEVVQAILRLESLTPGEALVLEATWDQQSGAGSPVAPGEYRVRAELLTEGDPLLSPAAPLRIAPR
ncbi:MAG: hypothetical protein KY466_02720 [Gemmatimonadetes bacterium]|nr:hypothetical protein [Gemmatimonadota bacterium]